MNLRWTPERRHELFLLREAGKIEADIAEHFGVSASSIRKVATRYNLPPSKAVAGRPRGRWTDERDAVITANYLKLSSEVIARKLGPDFTRNMVIGRAKRLGLSSEPGAKPESIRNGAKKAKETKVSREPSIKSFKPKEPVEVAQPIIEPSLPEPTTANVRLIDASEAQCKWMVDKEHVCAKAVRPGSSWCPEHYARVFQPPRPRKTETIWRER